MNYEILEGHKFVPVVVFNDLNEVKPKLSAMAQGGINVAEITYRTACAGDAIKLACKLFPNMLIGAGTILNEKMCQDAIDSGAKFVVSPGLDAGVAKVAIKNNLPYIPGVATPTEIMQALNLGLSYLKFFPCDLFGGIKTLKAYGGVFPTVKFMATGGVNLDNLKDYLSLNMIAAVGGSFVLKGSLIDVQQSCEKVCEIIKEIQ